MIVPKHGLLCAARLRRQVPGVTRVIIARTDGIALYDDVPLEQRDGGAALTAAVLGLGETASSSLDLGVLQFGITMSSERCLVVYPIDGAHLLAIIAQVDVDLGALGAAGHHEVETLRSLSGVSMAAL